MADLIERDALYDNRYKYSSGQAHKAYGIAIDDVCDAPAVDAVPVVRCKDCRYLYFKDMSAYCPHSVSACRPDNFCSCGERRADDWWSYIKAVIRRSMPLISGFRSVRTS